MTISVFLLDDHEVVRRGVRELLEAEGDIVVVGEAGDAETAVHRILELQPTVSLLDVRLPEGSGVAVCREVHATRPDLACVMLTSFADDEALAEAVIAGAQGYLLKQVRGVDIVAGVRKVAAGESLLDPVATEKLVARLRSGPDEDDLIAALTPQERKILGYLVEGKTNRQIAASMSLAEKTVKNYISNLLAKMGMSRRTEAAVYAARLAERNGG